MAFNIEEFFKGLLSSSPISGTTPTSIQQPPIPLAPAQILDQGFQQTKKILADGGVLSKQPAAAAPPPATPAPALTPDPETLKPFVPRVTTEPQIRPSDVLATARTAQQPPVAIPEPPRAPQVFTSEDFGIPDLPTREELAAKVPQFTMEDILRQPKVQLEQLATTLAKQQTETDAAAKQASTREDFGRRGLFFSGAREGAEKAIQDQALADKLKIDVRLAGILINAFDDARKESISAAEKILNEAKEGRKEAVAQINKLGFAVLPNGNVIETPAEIRAEEAAGRAARGEIRAEGREERAVSAEERAAAAAERAEAKFQRVFETRTIGDRVVRFEFDEQGNVISKSDLGPSGEAGFSRGEKNALAFDDIATRAAKRLEETRGPTDKFYNPADFMKFRDEVKENAPTFLEDFDKKFALELNPVDAKRLGITQEDLDPFEAIIRRTRGE